MTTPELRQLQEQQLQSMQGVQGLLASKEPARARRDIAWDYETAARELSDTMTVVVGISGPPGALGHERTPVNL
jgi:hypothetical protein